jgi:GAF domain-containing protein
LAVDLRELAHSIGTLADVDLTVDAEAALARAVGAARDLLEVDSAGLMVLDADGHLRWITSINGPQATGTVWQDHVAHGPAAVALEELHPVTVADVAADPRWQPIQAQLQTAGIKAALSVPVLVAGAPVAVLDLYRGAPGAWDDQHLATAQTYAGVLGLLLSSVLATAAADELASQLQHALTSRIQVEQAKGVLMARNGWSAPVAWGWLRAAARSSRRTVVAVARELLAEFDPAGAGSGRPA